MKWGNHSNKVVLTTKAFSTCLNIRQDVLDIKMIASGGGMILGPGD